MSPRTKVQQRWHLVPDASLPIHEASGIASLALTDAYTDFILSRQAMNCAPATLEFYKYTAGAFLFWTETQGVTAPEEVTAQLARSYLTGRESRSDRARTRASYINTVALLAQ